MEQSPLYLTNWRNDSLSDDANEQTPISLQTADPTASTIGPEETRDSNDTTPKGPKQIKPLDTATLTSPPCCIAFARNTCAALVGLYELNEEEQSESVTSQKRKGGIQLVQIAPRPNPQDGPQLILTHRKITPFGILDIARCPTELLSQNFRRRMSELFAVATSKGTIRLYGLEILRYNTGPTRTNVRPVQNWQVAEPNEIVTQLVWDQQRPKWLSFTLSSGVVKVLRLPSAIHEEVPGDESPMWMPTKMENNVMTFDLRAQVTAVFQHSLEAWTCSFPAPNPISFVNHSVGPVGVYSGGDDSVLAWNPIPMDEQSSTEISTASRAWVDRKTHQAGVTAVLPVSLGLDEDDQQLPDLLITGSYDDTIRVLALPDNQMGVARPRVLGELNLGGGVWRLKILNQYHFHTWSPVGASEIAPELMSELEYRIEIAVCCMYAGVKIVRLRGNGADSAWEIEVIAELKEHESMCYGLDMFEKQSSVPHAEGWKGLPFLTCSFYDKRLCLWQWQPGRHS